MSTGGEGLRMTARSGRLDFRPSTFDLRPSTSPGLRQGANECRQNGPGEKKGINPVVEPPVPRQEHARVLSTRAPFPEGIDERADLPAGVRERAGHGPAYGT